MPMTPVSSSQTAQQSHHPAISVPHQHQVTPSKVAILWKLGPQYSNRRSNYMRGDFLELEAEGQGHRISWCYITPYWKRRWSEERARGPTGESDEAGGENKETKSKE